MEKELYIIHGPQHYEVVGVQSSTKKEVLLDNGIRFNPKNQIVLNSRFNVLPYSDENAEYFEALQNTGRRIRNIENYFRKIKESENKEEVIKLSKKINRIWKKI